MRAESACRFMNEGTSQQRARTSTPAAVAVVVPTYNEAPNVAALVERLDKVLAAVPWEVVFVDDDSPDGTAALVRRIGSQDARVRCVQRLGRRGLSRAVIEGMLATSAPRVAVMDADLQHDESALPELLAALQRPEIDVAIGTRYLAGASAGSGGDIPAEPEGLSADRLRLSRGAGWLAAKTLGVTVSDPMSGFFAIRREAFEPAMRRLSGEGFKILLDILASSPRPLRVAEIPYRFRPRQAGQSKLDSAVVWEFVLLLLDKRFGRWLPARFLMFSAVGASGVAVHFVAFGALFHGLALAFTQAQSAGTLIAMTTNYALNNLFTYRDRRHRGLQWWRGLASFYLLCGLGIVANVGVAATLFEHQEGWFVASLAGALIGTVWNYVATSIVTWRRA